MKRFLSILTAMALSENAVEKERAKSKLRKKCKKKKEHFYECSGKITHRKVRDVL